MCFVASSEMAQRLPLRPTLQALVSDAFMDGAVCRFWRDRKKLALRTWLCPFVVAPCHSALKGATTWSVQPLYNQERCLVLSNGAARSFRFGFFASKWLSKPLMGGHRSLGGEAQKGGRSMGHAAAVLGGQAALPHIWLKGNAVVARGLLSQPKDTKRILRGSFRSWVLATLILT